MAGNTMGNAATKEHRLSTGLLRPELASVGILARGASVSGLARATVGS